MKRALVRRAAAMLDERYPGWHRKVKLTTLDLARPSCCVTTQIGIHSRERWELPNTILDATLWPRHDNTPSPHYRRGDVQEPWEDEIRARRKRVPA